MTVTDGGPAMPALETPPDGTLSLSGTSDDFDAVAAGSLGVAGTASLADDASAGGISVSTQGLLDFGGTLLAGGSAQAPDQTALALAANGLLMGSGTMLASGGLLALGGEMACFLRGTRLLTPNGYVPVEDFKPGDPVITRLGIRRAVRWIGRRNLETSLKTRQDLRPVTVLPEAIGPGIPSRPVRLSPSHALFLEGVRVPAMQLVNGATIRREPKRGTVSYFHIELDRHDVLMAEGLAVESYIDTGNRGEFQQELGVRGRGAKPCAPLVTFGPQLARIRHRLHQRILAAGFTLAQEPALRAVIGEASLEPEIRLRGAMRVARFRNLPACGRMLLLAQSAAPAETDPDSDDRRELAICLRAPRRLRLGEGWHDKAPGDAGIWMSGSGELFLPRNTAALTLNFIAVAQSWRPPVDSAGLGL